MEIGERGFVENRSSSRENLPLGIVRRTDVVEISYIKEHMVLCFWQVESVETFAPILKSLVDGSVISRTFVCMVLIDRVRCL